MSTDMFALVLETCSVEGSVEAIFYEEIDFFVTEDGVHCF